MFIVWDLRDFFYKSVMITLKKKTNNTATNSDNHATKRISIRDKLLVKEVVQINIYASYESSF